MVDIIKNAETELLLVSPYIKLHERVIEALKTLIEKPEVRVTVIYGKASGDKTTTFDKSSIKFLKTLPNIEIAHRQNLHAKFYANDYESILCSLNLYDYSKDVNIEAGYLINNDSPKKIREEQNSAWDFFFKIFNGADLMYDNQANFESRFFHGKKYISSEVVIDILDKEPQTKAKKKEKEKPSGYCIASGKSIPFNIEKPLCRNEFKRWIEETDGGDLDCPMEYCHFSGEKSKGKQHLTNPFYTNIGRKLLKHFLTYENTITTYSFIGFV